MSISDIERELNPLPDDFAIIEIPPDGSYVEIMGHRITRDVGSFEGFLEYLIDLERIKREYEDLNTDPSERRNGRSVKEIYKAANQRDRAVAALCRERDRRIAFEDAVREALRMIDSTTRTYDGTAREACRQGKMFDMYEFMGRAKGTADAYRDLLTALNYYGCMKGE